MTNFQKAPDPQAARPDRSGFAFGGMARRARWLRLVGSGALIMGVCLVIIGAKFQLIRNYGSQVPFNDQWSAEALRLYRPWLRHALTWRELFASSNEHRIFFTRVIDIFVLALNGQWDSRVLMVVNAFLPVGFAMLLVRTGLAYLTRFEGCIFAICAALLFSSNVSYGNTLWGFQSQFYLCILFSLLHIGLTFLAEPFRYRWWIGQLVGLANLFTNAAGVLSSVAIALIAIWAIVIQRDRRKGDVIVFGWNLLVVIFGLVLSPVKAHDAMGPHTASEIARAMANMFAWPFSAVADSQMWIITFAPAVVWLAIYLCGKKPRAVDRALAALVVVVVAQDLVFALFRGVAWSRYLDNLSLGLVANLACLLAWRCPTRLMPAKLILLGVWIGLVGNALFTQQRDFEKRAFPSIPGQTRADLTLIRKIVGGETVDMSGAAAGCGLRGIQEVVTDATIRPILPVSMRASLRLRDTNGSGFERRKVNAEELPLSPWPGFTAFTRKPIKSIAEFSSSPISTNAYSLTFLVKGTLEPPGSSLTLTTSSGKELQAGGSRLVNREGWAKVNFRAPDEPFSVMARCEAGNVFEFSEPVETPRMTAITEWVLEYAETVWWTGFAAIGAGVALWSFCRRNEVL
jgi:hypothetical protein